MYRHAFAMNPGSPFTNLWLCGGQQAPEKNRARSNRALVLAVGLREGKKAQRDPI
jgi:hypothetical protein